jgi:hypothetical protein
MPKWTPPDSTDTAATRGLFRGRFGTTPVSAESGEAVIFFPCRFWDRWHERADDPEMAHFQVTLNESPVWMTGLTWEVEQTDPLVELHCLVRVDGRSAWTDDPKKAPGMFLLDKGKVDNKSNPLAYQGSRIEARFATIYKPGSFDGRQFLKSSWKVAPFCKSLGISFEGQTRVLSEAFTAR